MLYFKVLLCFLLSINLYGNSLVVVVSKDSLLNSISKKELSKIFLAKTKRAPNGQEIVAIELLDEKLQRKFYKEISNKNPKQLKKYWAKMIFTGRGQPPKKAKSLEKLLEFIKNNENAISYVPLKDVNEYTKIILRID